MRLLRIARAIVGLDLRLELRRPVGLAGTLLFGAGSLVALHLALAGGGKPTPAVAAGALWIVLVYGALLGVGRVLTIEREDGTWDALLLAGSDRTAIFAGKTASAFVQCLLLHGALVPLYLSMFGTPPGSGLPTLLAAVLLADLGFALVGVLVGVISLRARGRELLGATMFLPLTMPLVIVAVTASLAAWGAAPDSDPARLLGFLLLYDAMFAAIGVAAFPELAVE